MMFWGGVHRVVVFGEGFIGMLFLGRWFLGGRLWGGGCRGVVFQEGVMGVLFLGGGYKGVCLEKGL